MDNNTLLNIVQEGFRTVIGATTEAIETIQDNQKRHQVFSDLSTQWQQKSKEWSQKGTMTEQEAKKIIEQFFQGYTNKNQSPQPINITVDDEENEDISSLTKEIIALREEIQSYSQK
ncbi:hypothetical protein ACN4EE_15135 [Geminocystis sp. CENA526]|uniref:hypothetical protein n=1 Tax=Geminocystis sp. CENA526 TaxID=1355871 RepID=UPI003D6EC9AB